MPIINGPPRRLLTMLQRLRSQPETRDEAQSKDRVEFKTIERVNADGSYVVAGTRVAASSAPAQLRAGQRHPVLMRNGQPYVIFAHNARRAQFAPPVFVGGRFLEELFITPVGGINSLYFRNDEQVTRVTGVDQSVLDDASQIKWGQRANSFAVVSFDSADAVLRVRVYTLTRGATQSLGARKPGKATLISTLLARPHLLLNSGAYNYSKNGNVKWPTFNHDVGPDTYTCRSPGLDPLADTGSSSHSLSVYLDSPSGFAPQGFLSISLVDVFVDERLKVYGVYSLTFNNVYGSAPGEVPSGATHRYKTTPDACANGAIVTADESASPRPSAGISEQHHVIVNLTDGVIVESTMEAASTLIISVAGDAVRSTGAASICGGGISIATGFSYPAGGADPIQGVLFDDTANHNNPAVCDLGGKSDSISVDRSLFDVSKSWSPMTPATRYATSVTTAYWGIGYSNMLAAPISKLSRGVKYSLTTTSAQQLSVRFAQLRPIRFSKGKIRLMWCSMRVLDGAVKVGVLADGVFKPIPPQDDGQGTGFHDFLYATGHHVVFALGVPNVTESGITDRPVYMATLDKKTFDVTEVKKIGSSSQEFTGRDFRFLFPDLMYYPNNAGAASGNRFISFLNKTGAITLDQGSLAYPSSDPRLKDASKLKNLPAGVSVPTPPSPIFEMPPVPALSLQVVQDSDAFVTAGLKTENDGGVK